MSMIAILSLSAFVGACVVGFYWAFKAAFTESPGYMQGDGKNPRFAPQLKKAA